MKLVHKGLILVLVPVAFELVFVASLFYMLQQAELERLRVERARLITEHLNNIQNLLMIAPRGLPVYQNGIELHGHARSLEMERREDEEFGRLRETVKDDPQMLAMAAKLQKSLREVMFLSTDIKSVWEVLAKLKSKSGIRRSQELFDNLFQQMDLMWEIVEKIDADSPKREAENRSTIKLLLLLGLGINISLAIGLAFYFNRDTARRLTVVMSNANSFAKNQTINEPLSGSDEIALLDGSLYEMAINMNELSQKEKALLIHAADVICSVDEHGIITDVSPACEKVWGYTVDEVLSLPLNRLVLSEDANLTNSHIQSVRETGAESTFENRVVRKDGSAVDMLWSITWSAADKTFFCVAHDNTERKTAERMKQEFVAMLSHDLRSPLNSVHAFFTMVSNQVYGSLSERGMAKVASLENTVSWLIEMISDLLDIDKIEAGLADLDLSAISLKAIVQKADEALDSLSAKRNVLTVLPEQDADVLADEAMFLRVVTNLLSNAIKFAPEHSEVTIEIEKSDEFVELRIIDRGKGIAPEYQASIFEKFRQVRETGTSQKARSSGLGLAVSKAIVEQHRGSIGVRSALGQGSTFWVRLPSVKFQGDQRVRD